MKSSPNENSAKKYDTGSLLAGVAKSEITYVAPDARVHDPLYAKVLVLDDGSKQIILVTMDAVAIGGIGDVSDDFLPRLRQRVEKELGVPGGHVVVNASHTHPPGRLLCDDEAQVERTFDAIRRAIEAKVPVTIGHGRGREERIIINRILRLKNGEYWTIRHGHPCPPDEAVAELGPVDADIGILRIDRLDGRPLALVYNYACHTLIGMPDVWAITGNFPAFASRVIEDHLGEGAMALFIQGAAGDVTELLYKDVNRPRDAEPLGVMLGLSTLDAWRTIPTGQVTLAMVTEHVRFPLKNDFTEQTQRLKHRQTELLASLRATSLNFKTFLPLYMKHMLSPEYPSDYAYHYLRKDQYGDDSLGLLDAQNQRNLDKYLRNIHAMEELSKIEDDLMTLEKHRKYVEALGTDSVEAEIIGLRIGDCVIITAPVEVMTEVSLNIKRNSPAEHTMVAAFTNGYYHYGSPAKDYGRGHYEVTECMLGPDWQQVFESSAAGIIHTLLNRA